LYTICGISLHKKDIVRNNNSVPAITRPLIEIDAGRINDGLIEGVMLNGDVVDMFPMFYSNSIDLVFTIRTCSIDDIVLDRYVMDASSWDFCADCDSIVSTCLFCGPPDGVVMDSYPAAELTIVQLGVDVDSLAAMMACKLDIIMVCFAVCAPVGEDKVYFSDISEGVIADDGVRGSIDCYPFFNAFIVLYVIERTVVDIDVLERILGGIAFFVEPYCIFCDIVKSAVLNNDVVAASSIRGGVCCESLF